MSVRGWWAVLLALAFGGACYWACRDRGAALLSFAGVTIVAGWYIGGRLAPWLVLALVIGIIVTVTSILGPLLGIALTIIGFIAWIIWIIPTTRILKTFLRRLPYLVTSCAAYACPW
ncbi:MAG TPA: hypothetical protein VHZ03_10300 [Trebonia sp.]|nr:hypothetical protein [Trebonia sp.]